MLKKKDLLNTARITQTEFESSGLKWNDLEAIYADYDPRRTDLDNMSQLISKQLQKVNDVHSVRQRIKDPDHLIIKIIRKSIQYPDRVINISNYLQEITDLVGVRALHLFKSNWASIHELIEKTWELNEVPKAYIREGDLRDSTTVFSDAGFNIEEHPSGYRSLHYNIITPLGKINYIAEVQVRTIFEEGWSEIDHTIRYPNNTKNSVINAFLMVFNRMAGGADEMGSFIQLLKRDVDEKENEINELKAKIDKLEIKPDERNSLKQAISDLFVSNKSDSFNTLSEYININSHGLFNTDYGITSDMSKAFDNIMEVTKTINKGPKSE